MTRLRLYLAPLCAAFIFSACSPTFDWREVRGGGAAPFTVVMPAKPASHARPVNLEGIRVTMTMTAAEAEGITFAVATAELPDAAQAQAALKSMKAALVRNIGGAVRKENASSAGDTSTLEVEASGPQRAFAARFVARGSKVYQVLAMGNASGLNKEAVDTFLTSFKPE